MTGLLLAGCSAADSGSTDGPTRETIVPSPSPSLAMDVREESEVKAIPFTKTTVQSADFPVGTTQVTTAGVDGQQRITYSVTYENDAEVSRTTIGTEVLQQPVVEVTTIGTYVAPAQPAAPAAAACDPNYSGACVPVASDVDCAGGSGNGPAYVRGPVYVVGTDIYDLDRDGDGVGCQ